MPITAQASTHKPAASTHVLHQYEGLPGGNYSREPHAPHYGCLTLARRPFYTHFDPWQSIMTQTA